MMNQSCIDSAAEYRAWRESPQWYCIKTTLDALTGEIKRELVKEESGQVITINGFDKPLDGVYETTKETIYYTYHQGFTEAEMYLAARA